MARRGKDSCSSGDVLRDPNGSYPCHPRTVQPRSHGPECDEAMWTKLRSVELRLSTFIEAVDEVTESLLHGD